MGGVISPLLANIALHVLDEEWAEHGRHLGVLVRYADDHVILCPTKERAVEARSRVSAILAALGLRLHPDKTRIVDLRKGGEGFDFLGFHHRMRTSQKRRGRYYLNKWPSARAMASIRAKIRDRTNRRHASRDLRYVVSDLNPVLRGWGAYFRVGNSSKKFVAVDSYVNERLARLTSVKHGMSGRNWVTRFNYQWASQLGIYRLGGTVRHWAAHA